MLENNGEIQVLRYNTGSAIRAFFSRQHGFYCTLQCLWVHTRVHKFGKKLHAPEVQISGDPNWVHSHRLQNLCEPGESETAL